MNTGPVDVRLQDLSETRDKVTRLITACGRMVGTITNEEKKESHSDLHYVLNEVFHCTIETALSFEIDLTTSCMEKLKVNRKKYPLKLCAKNVSARDRSNILLKYVANTNSF